MNVRNILNAESRRVFIIELIINQQHYKELSNQYFKYSQSRIT